MIISPFICRRLLCMNLKEAAHLLQKERKAAWAWRGFLEFSSRSSGQRKTTPTALNLSVWCCECPNARWAHGLTQHSLSLPWKTQRDPANHTEQEQGRYFHVRAKTTDLEHDKGGKTWWCRRHLKSVKHCIALRHLLNLGSHYFPSDNCLTKNGHIHSVTQLKPSLHVSHSACLPALEGLLSLSAGQGSQEGLPGSCPSSATYKSASTCCRHQRRSFWKLPMEKRDSKWQTLTK